MAANAREKDPAKVLEDMERERREMEERFTIKAGEAEKLREQEVLSEYGRYFDAHTGPEKMVCRT